MLKHFSFLLGISAGYITGGICSLWAAEPLLADPPGLAAEVTALTHRLDSHSYVVRQLAQQRFDALAANPDLSPALAEIIAIQWVRSDLSQEVRAELQRLREKLPPASARWPDAVPTAEIDRLIAQLNDSSYAARSGAAVRLQWLGGDPRLAGMIMVCIKRQSASDDLGLDAFSRLEVVRQTVWSTWLSADSPDAVLPPASQAQIEQWLNRIAVIPETPEQGFELQQRLAREEILDRLAIDREAPRVIKLLQERLRQPRRAEVAERYRELLDLTHPAMVAECWVDRKMFGEQHLLVGVASQNPGGLRPSHFDRIDDQTAHCVSGATLSPGNYPVAVAFPHPIYADRFFHLVNLPTARRRIAYSYYVKTDEAAHLSAISRRTLERYSSERHPLTDAELGMLSLLDPHEVSRFAGAYFLKVDDQAVEPGPETVFINTSRRFGQSSLHNAVCVCLAIDGDKEAAPGLLAAIRQKRFLPPTPQGPYRMAFVAALAIAGRDPWPAADDWLASLLDCSDPVMIDRRDAPTIGATAAGMLLLRHSTPHDAQGLNLCLEACVDPLLVSVGISAYRYRSPAAMEKIQAWWIRESQRRKEKPAAQAAASLAHTVGPG